MTFVQLNLSACAKTAAFCNMCNFTSHSSVSCAVPVCLIVVQKIQYQTCSVDCFYCLQASKVTLADGGIAPYQEQAGKPPAPLAQPSLLSAVAHDGVALPELHKDANGRVSRVGSATSKQYCVSALLLALYSMLNAAIANPCSWQCLDVFLRTCPAWKSIVHHIDWDQ